jgi:exosortase
VNIVKVYLGPVSFYTHGFLIPFACAYLLWEQKTLLNRFPPSSWPGGIALVALGCLLHLFGLRASVSFASGISLLIVILGLLLYHRGIAYTIETLPALGLLLFMIPLPQWLLYQMTFSLKMWAAAIGSTLMGLFGLPVLRDGIYITCPEGIPFAIEDPCSGLRSIVSLTAFAYILAVMADVSSGKKFLILLAAPFLAWAGNIVRVVISILLVYCTGLPGSSFTHIAIGIGSFILSLLALVTWSNHLLCRELRGGSR